MYSKHVDIVISIHALRGEGDHGFVKLYNKQKISIHALRGEGDIGGNNGL